MNEPLRRSIFCGCPRNDIGAITEHDPECRTMNPGVWIGSVQPNVATLATAGVIDEPTHRWRVGARLPLRNGEGEHAEVEVTGTRADAMNALGDLLEGLGVESWVEEIE